MNHTLWVELLVGALGIGVTITLALMRIIFVNLNRKMDNLENKVDNVENKINDRLRTLQHEDRDIRATIDGWGKILIEVVSKINSGKR